MKTATVIKSSVMGAIRTKYHGPTNSRGARITATSSGGHKLTIPLRHELSTERRHALAAEMLCQKMDWSGTLIQGGLSDGYVFVFSSTK